MLAAMRLGTRGTTHGRALQAYLGHRNIQHTVRYTELSPTQVKNFWRVTLGALNPGGVRPWRVYMLKDRVFTYRGHTFQVRATISEKGWVVQVYENGKPISPPYKVTHETAIDYSTAGWGMPLKPLCIPLRTTWRKNIFQR